MKFDVLTLIVAIFTLGVLVSSFNLEEAFASEPEPVSELHQGVLPLKK